MKKNMMLEIFGWLAAVAILVATAAVSFGWLHGTSRPFLILNLFGGLGIAAISAHKRAWQPAILNTIWVIIAIVGLAKSL